MSSRCCSRSRSSSRRSPTLEWPGKRRLGRGDYLVVQRIFYPGFTLVGMVTELPAVVTAAAALVVGGWSASRIVAAAALVVVSVVFWVVVQPVNRRLVGGLGQVTSSHPPQEGPDGDDHDWRRLRDRWEVGHAVRALGAAAALASLVWTLAGR